MADCLRCYGDERTLLSRNARKCEKAVVLRLLVAWLSVHTALSEPNRTVRNRVARLFLPASSVWNSLVFWPFTRGFLSSQVEPNWAKPGKRARVNEVLMLAGVVSASSGIFYKYTSWLSLDYCQHFC